MDMTLTDEQELVRETVTRAARQLGNRTPDELLARRVCHADDWAVLADLGFTGLPTSSEVVEGRGIMTAIVACALAAELATVPFIGRSVMAAGLLSLAGADDLCEAVAMGELRATVLLDGSLTDVADAVAGSVAADALGASHAVAVREVSGGVEIVLVDLDPTAVWSPDLTRPQASPRPGPGEVLGRVLCSELEQWRASTLVACAADAVGAMTAAFDLAVDYAKQRHQYGRAIGSFQAIQHLLADQYVVIEGCRTAVNHAAWALDTLGGQAALRAARIAKAATSAAGVQVAETVIQVHGGIGFTWEHSAHLYLRRVLLDRQLLGSEEIQYLRLGRMFLDQPGDTT